MGPLSEHRERLQELERDKKTLLESYADMLPDALDGLTAEERNRIYRMLRLKVRASEDKSIEISEILSNKKPSLKPRGNDTLTPRPSPWEPSDLPPGYVFSIFWSSPRTRRRLV